MPNIDAQKQFIKEINFFVFGMDKGSLFEPSKIVNMLSVRHLVSPAGGRLLFVMVEPIQACHPLEGFEEAKLCRDCILLKFSN